MRLGSILMSGLLIAALSAPAQAEWLPEQVATFMRECLAGCEQVNTDPSDREKCTPYCTCVATEGQSRFPNSSDYEELDGDARAKRDTPKLRQFAEIYPVCSRRAYGR
jgi:hypothetical protein